MHRIGVLILFTACLGLGLAGQSTLVLRPTIQIGYSSVDSLNGVLQRYNERHDDLKPLDEIHVLTGPSLSLSLAAEKAFFEFGTGFQWAGTKSIDSPSQNTQEYLTKVRTAYYTVNLGAAYRLHEMFSAGLSLDIGTSILKMKRGYRPEVTTAKLSPVSRDVVLGSSAFVQVDIRLDDYFSIGIRPFCHYNFIRSDYGQLNRNLNFSSYLQDNQFILGHTGQFGLRIGLGMWMQ